MRSLTAINAPELLRGLVALPSVSGSEAAAVDWLVERMAELGYRAYIDPAGNAVGEIGAGAQEIMLLGHIDTVPGEIAVRIEDGILYGRGAVDAKGPLATFVAAAAQAVLPPGIRVTVIGAIGEETFGSPGASWLRDNHTGPAALIIGEPSGWDGVVLGYKGSVSLTARVERGLSHSAGPEITAAQQLFNFWSALSAWLAAHNGDIEPGFSSLDATLRELHSGSDGLHEWSSLTATFRMPPGVTSDWVTEQVNALAEPHAIELGWTFNAEAYRSERTSPLVAPFLASIRAQGGQPRIKVKTGTSDMNIVAPVWGCPTVAYGPGDARYDHTPDEQISFSDLEQGVAVLSVAIERIAAQLTRRQESQ
jgi:LysW-gamma-L-lysine carboxypeptidase